jgi:Xaa-Pro aminopeptidase
MRKLGAEGISFDTIAASGQNGATPHAKPTDRKLKNGEFITLDFGCKYQGYCSDITRTIAIGKVEGRLKEIYQLVERAQQAGISSTKLKDVKTVGEVDKITRQVIEDAGYGQNSTHSTGHGIGLEVHELPHVSRGQATKLKTGMVFTVEPGIYIPGLGGVRIEDCVVIDWSGEARVLGSRRRLSSL